MCHPKQKALSQSLIDEDPFLYLKIDDTSILDSIDSRRPCTKCCKSRKYFCYTCYVPVEDLQGKLPVVKVCINFNNFLKIFINLTKNVNNIMNRAGKNCRKLKSGKRAIFSQLHLVKRGHNLN